MRERDDSLLVLHGGLGLSGADISLLVLRWWFCGVAVVYVNNDIGFGVFRYGKRRLVSLGTGDSGSQDVVEAGGADGSLPGDVPVHGCRGWRAYIPRAQLSRHLNHASVVCLLPHLLESGIPCFDILGS